MVFEKIEDIIQLLKANLKVPQHISEAREYHKELKALVLGEEFMDLLLQLEHVEGTKKSKARIKNSRSIQDSVSRMLRLLENVYTATGGSKHYDIKSETELKKILSTLSNLRDNKSLEKWVQEHWLSGLFIVDPSGLMFLEYDAENEILPYPTYKSIDNIRNYEAKGQNVEWLIFEPKKVKNINSDNFTTESIHEEIRFVDDKKDYTFKKDGDNFILIEDKTFEHEFGTVPAIINSPIIQLGKKKRYSFIDDIIPLLKEMLKDQSVLSIFKDQNGIATPILPFPVCSSCKGSGKSGADDCEQCDGTGKGLKTRDVTDVIYLPVSMNPEEAVNVPTGAFTYMTPPIEIWDKYDATELSNYNKANDTLYGSHMERFESDRTAFETFVSLQPVTTTLSWVSEIAEWIEFQFTEWIANHMMPTKPKDQHISTISYGKMFIIEPVDALMEKYRVNRESGVSTLVLDRQMLEIITSKYKNNPQVLRAELTKKELEYYVHYDLQQVIDAFGQTEAQKKIIFTDWWETISFQEIKDIDTEALKIQRDEWINAKIEELKPKEEEPSQIEEDNNLNNEEDE